MGSIFIIINSLITLTCVFYVWGWWCGSPCLGPAAFSWRLHPADDIAPAPRGSAGGRAWVQCSARTRSSRWSRPEDTQTQTQSIHHCLRAAGSRLITPSLLSAEISTWIIWCSTWRELGNIRRMRCLHNLRSLGLNYCVCGNCVLKEQKNAIQKTKGDKICSCWPFWTGSNDKINVLM